ncbi:apolipoprotein N-acyltransferase [Zwartia sp.]|uniref:apolipoprotein N-acyltransferase n=1 Tax=Zwartia sp. TaxID=2978004 RepID=UPI002722651C|nr:apolipoprotein N-acyltransferase [Zwartia sp.]MDO9024821.1 apolipoprotein N-acyltransferase [Zwartia sp.]
MNAFWLKWRLTLGLLVGGALHALSFAPDPLPQWALSPLQLCTMAWLVTAVWRAPSGLYAARRAWIFALAYFVVGLYWLTISMHVYGYMPLPLAIAALIALSAYLALFASLAAWLVHKVKALPSHAAAHSTHGSTAVATTATTTATATTSTRSTTSPASTVIIAALAWASAWTLAEWLRATLLTGFPWLNTGYAHVDSAFVGWASILGLYGVTFATAFTAAAIAALVGIRYPAGTTTVSTDPTNPPTQTKRALVGVIALAIALVGWGLSQISWSTPTGTPLVVRLVQGNIDQGIKFTPDRLYSVIQEHLRLADTPVPPGSPQPQVVLLPETAMAVFQHQIAPAAWQAWVDIAKRQNSTILMGAALFDQRTGTYTNSVIGLNGTTTAQQLFQGTVTQRYDKHHLVPFGEFVPLGFRWFVDLMSIPLGDFTRGSTTQQPFAIDGQYLAPNICYEDVFGEELLPAVRGGSQTKPDGATILANFSNLAWFGDSWALRQHWQMSRMRAIEVSRPMLRATNTGATGLIDHRGRDVAQLPPNRLGVLDTTVQGQKGLTPYTLTGNGLILGFAILLLIGIGLRGRRR